MTHESSIGHYELTVWYCFLYLSVYLFGRETVNKITSNAKRKHAGVLVRMFIFTHSPYDGNKNGSKWYKYTVLK